MIDFGLMCGFRSKQTECPIRGMDRIHGLEMDSKSRDPGCRSHKKKEVTHGMTLHRMTSLHGNVEEKKFFTFLVLSFSRERNVLRILT